MTTDSLLQFDTSIKRVLIIGAECTGKTTLCKDLAKHFGSVFASEYLRDYLENKPKDYICQYEDLLTIAKGQINQENNQLQYANRYLFCDTALFETMVYAYWYFNRCPIQIEQAVKTHHYDFIFLSDDNGIPWVADGMRDMPNGRQKMRKFFIQYLKKFDLPFLTISGTRQERLAAVKKILINKKQHS